MKNHHAEPDTAGAGDDAPRAPRAKLRRAASSFRGAIQRVRSARTAPFGRAKLTLTFVKRSGQTRNVRVTVTARRGMHELDHLLEAVAQGGAVYITREDETRGVVISPRQYEQLTHHERPGLDDLRDEFDALVERMRTPDARENALAALRASPEELGRAAVAAAARARE